MLDAATINGREVPLRIKLRVKGNERVCPLDHGRDITSGTVVAGPQFKILKAIVVSSAIAVVNGFFGRERTPKRLFHGQAMFQHLPALHSVLVGKAEADVTLAGNVALYLPTIRWPQAFMLGQFERLAALRTAKRVAMVTGSSLTPNGLNVFSALNALLDGGQPLGLSSATRRTVERVFAKYLSVFSEIARSAREFLLARGAVESAKNYIARTPMNRLVSAVARLAAIFTNFRVLDAKIRAALDALFINQHFDCPFVGLRGYIRTTTGWMQKETALKGAA